jgi:hypothetical protein
LFQLTLFAFVCHQLAGFDFKQFPANPIEGFFGGRQLLDNLETWLLLEVHPLNRTHLAFGPR